jgi:hypothetical protein
MMGGFPPHVRVTLKYSETFTLAGTATVAARLYGMNCCYDPYLGTGGHQPSAFDTWMYMYGFYTVTGCTAKMYYCNDATGSAQPAVWGMIPSVQGTAVSGLGTISYLREQPNVWISKRPSGIVNAPIDSPMSARFDISQAFAGGGDIRALSTWRGTSSTNPGDIAYLEVFHGSQNGSTTGTFSYTVELEMEVEFWSLLTTISSKKSCPKTEWEEKEGEGSRSVYFNPIRPKEEEKEVLPQASRPHEVVERRGGAPRDASPPPAKGWFA